MTSKQLGARGLFGTEILEAMGITEDMVAEYRLLSSTSAFSGIGVDNNLENFSNLVLKGILTKASPINDIFEDDSADVTEFGANRQLRDLTTKSSFDRINQFFKLLEKMGMSNAITTDTVRVFVGSPDAMKFLIGEDNLEGRIYSDFVVHVSETKDEFYGLKQLMENLISEGAISSEDIVALETLNGYDFGAYVNDGITARDVISAIDHHTLTQRAKYYLENPSTSAYASVFNVGKSCDYLTLSIKIFAAEDLSSPTEKELEELEEKSNIIFENLAEENHGATSIFYPFAAAFKKL